MRLDKFINDITGLGRSSIKKEIRYGKVHVNGMIVKKDAAQIDPEHDVITYDGRTLQYVKNYYYVMNKPAGVVSAARDAKDPVVVGLLQDDVPAHVKKRLFPVGRLDKDAEGLLILTDDGELSHRLLSPAHHVEKTYYCLLEHSIGEADIRMLENGVDIGEKRMTLPATVCKLSDREIELTVTEGKYHQVKRMLLAVDNRVLYLRRTKMGGLSLPEDLAPGAYRLLTEKEEKQLKI